MKTLLVVALLIFCTFQQVVPIQIRVSFDYQAKIGFSGEDLSISILWNNEVVWSGSADSQQHHKEVTFKSSNGDNIFKFSAGGGVSISNAAIQQQSSTSLNNGGNLSKGGKTSFSLGSNLMNLDLIVSISNGVIVSQPHVPVPTFRLKLKSAPRGVLFPLFTGFKISRSINGGPEIELYSSPYTSYYLHSVDIPLEPAFGELKFIFSWVWIGNIDNTQDKSLPNL